MTPKTYTSDRLEEQIRLLHEINHKIDYAIELIRADYLHFPYNQSYYTNHDIPNYKDDQ